VARIESHFAASVVHGAECRVEDNLKMKRRDSCSVFRVLLLATLSTSTLAGSSAQARDIFVAKTGSDTNAGDAAHPFLTIQHAAEMAYPGDTINVHAGVYRERVDPPRGGTLFLASGLTGMAVVVMASYRGASSKSPTVRIGLNR